MVELFLNTETLGSVIIFPKLCHERTSVSFSHEYCDESYVAPTRFNNLMVVAKLSFTRCHLDVIHYLS